MRKKAVCEEKEERVEMMTVERCLANCRILDGWTSKLDSDFMELFKVDIEKVGVYTSE